MVNSPIPCFGQLPELCSNPRSTQQEHCIIAHKATWPTFLVALNIKLVLGSLPSRGSIGHSAAFLVAPVDAQPVSIPISFINWNREGSPLILAGWSAINMCTVHVARKLHYSAHQNCFIELQILYHTIQDSCGVQPEVLYWSFRMKSISQ